MGTEYRRAEVTGSGELADDAVQRRRRLCRLGGRATGGDDGPRKQRFRRVRGTGNGGNEITVRTSGSSRVSLRSYYSYIVFRANKIAPYRRPATRRNAWLDRGRVKSQTKSVDRSSRKDFGARYRILSTTLHVSTAAATRTHQAVGRVNHKFD